MEKVPISALVKSFGCYLLTWLKALFRAIEKKPEPMLFGPAELLCTEPLILNKEVGALAIIKDDW